MKNSIVGVDIGGSKIRAILWDGKRVLKTREIKTPKNLTSFKRALRKLIGNLTPLPPLLRPPAALDAQHLRAGKERGGEKNSPFPLTKGKGGQRGLGVKGGGVTKVGIAVPGRVRGATFVSAANISYIHNLNFRKIFQNLNIKIDHDARCFARAELEERRGLGGGDRSFFFLTLGTGVGRAVGEIKNGKPVIRRVREFEYAERWEKEYKKIRDSKNNRALAIYLNIKLKKLFKEFNPEIIVVGGGVAERKGFLKLLQKKIGLPRRNRRGLPVKKARFGKNSIAIGAALLF